MTHPTTIFNRKLCRLRRDRAALQFADYDFLLQEAVDRLMERLEDMTRTHANVLDIGCHTGQVSRKFRGKFGIRRLVSCDVSYAMVCQVSGEKLVCDEEFLPFAPDSFDLVVSALSLHWVNDLPGCLSQIYRLLKPGGMILLSMLGGKTLHELRESLLYAEMQSKGVSPRVSPFIEVKTMGSLLQRAGFSSPVSDSDTVTLSYDGLLDVADDLRGMAESAAFVQQSVALSRKILHSAQQHYQEKYRDKEDGISATFEIVTGMAVK